MSQLAAGVTRLAKINARKMAIEEKYFKYLLGDTNGRSMKIMRTRKIHGRALLKLRMMNHSHSTNPNPLVYNQLSSSFMSPSEFIPPVDLTIPPFSPVIRIGTLSNIFKLQKPPRWTKLSSPVSPN